MCQGECPFIFCVQSGWGLVVFFYLKKDHTIWRWVSKEINQIMKLDVAVSPRIALLSIFDREHQDGKIEELITNLVTAEGLIIIAKNWKLKYELQKNDWYK